MITFSFTVARPSVTVKAMGTSFWNYRFDRSNLAVVKVLSLNALQDW